MKWLLLDLKLFNNIVVQNTTWSVNILGNDKLFNLLGIQLILFSGRLGIDVCSLVGPPDRQVLQNRFKVNDQISIALSHSFLALFGLTSHGSLH